MIQHEMNSQAARLMDLENKCHELQMQLIDSEKSKEDMSNTINQLLQEVIIYVIL
jgi:HPt (histidine-containing phosphotransfer) domain-containing protein